MTTPPPGRSGASPRRDARAWAATLARYREPDPRRSVLELLATAVPFAAFRLLAWACLGLGYWLSLLFAVPAAGFLVRLFMIQHDCGHGSFFRRRRANDWLGRAIGVLTLTPYDHWRRTQAVHHATSGNLDRRGTGDGACTRGALHGSSHYDLPGLLRWLTANIGVHHVHHVCSLRFIQAPILAGFGGILVGRGAGCEPVSCPEPASRGSGPLEPLSRFRPKWDDLVRCSFRSLKKSLDVSSFEAYPTELPF